MTLTYIIKQALNEHSSAACRFQCMKHTYAIFLVALAVAFLAGCRSEDPLRHFVVADSPLMFNVVTPLSGRAAASVVDGVRYDIVFDDVARVATITISNLRCSEHDEGVDAIFSDIDFTYEPGSHQKQRIIEQKQINSLTDPGVPVTLSDVTFVYAESNELNPSRSSGFYAEFTVNDTYRVLAYPYEIYADGTTTVYSSVSAGRDEIDYDPVYTITLRPSEMTADVDIRGLTVDGSEHDIAVRGLTLQLQSDGYSLKMSGATQVSAASLPGATLTGFNATALLRDELNVNFELSTGSGNYIVEAFLSPDMCKKAN